MSGEIKLEYHDPIKIECGFDGVSMDKIIDALSNESKNAFKEAMKQLIEEPDEAKRNAEYADILDAFDESCVGQSIMDRSWKKDYNFVALKGFSKDALIELEYIFLYMSSSDGETEYSMNGQLFGEHIGVTTEKLGHVDFLNWLGYITPNWKIMLQSPEGMNEIFNFIDEEGEAYE